MSNKDSGTQHLLDEIDKLLNSTWNETDKELIQRMAGTLQYYKTFMPKVLKQDVRAILEIANRIKREYDELLVKYKKYDIENECQADLKVIEDDIKELEKEIKLERD